MTNAVFYGLIIAVANALYSLVLYYLGYQTDKMEEGKILGYIGLLIPVIVICIAMNDAKKTALEEQVLLGYGSVFKTGFLTSVFWGLGGALFAYVYFAFVNTEKVEYVLEEALTQLEAKNAPPEQIEGAEMVIRVIFKPWVQAIIAPFIAIVIGSIISLITAPFFRVKELLVSTGAEDRTEET